VIIAQSLQYHNFDSIIWEGLVKKNNVSTGVKDAQVATKTNKTLRKRRPFTTMEPTPEEAADGSILVKVLAAVLERLVNSNKSTARLDGGQLTKFHALKAPGIGVEAYLDRVHKYASCSNECFILALIYIDRLIERNNFLLTELNVHRVVITAILLAAKFFDDAYYNNAYYAKVGGVLVSELNGLEVDFLFRINFSLHVQPDVFTKYKAELVAHSINSGLIPAQLVGSVATSQQLPHIPEIDAGAGANILLNSGIINQSESNHKEQQQSTMKATSIDASDHDSMMGIPAHVTPSPSNSSGDVSRLPNNASVMGVHPIQGETSAEATTQAPMQQSAKDIMKMRGGTTNSVSLQQAHHTTTLTNEILSQQQEEQSLLLQRANSLPRFSSGRSHEFKLPYSAPTMPATAPVIALDHMQYQVMVNQLFPIENTLVHHNHQGAGTTASTTATMQDHHANATAGLVSHHPGFTGVGLGPMAYQVSWSGQIR